MVLRVPFSVLVILPTRRPNLAIAIRYRDDDNPLIDWILERLGEDTCFVITGFDGSVLRPSITLENGREVVWLGRL